MASTTETTLLVEGVKGKLVEQGAIKECRTSDALRKFAMALATLLAGE
jgi:hypothetical protein